jgi:pimeloyl-ACP methyl ester carboxylesterase
VVSKVFQGESVTVMATQKAKTNVSFKGKAKALAALERRCHRLAGLGHAPFWEAPGDFDSLLERFLRDVEASAGPDERRG